jgi:hypothetical protein
VGAGPYNGSKVYCAAACAWNGSSCLDRKPTAYPMPANDSLELLAGSGSPLQKLDGIGGAPGVRISFYGDSITWVNKYEPVISKALAAGSGTEKLNITINNQGINGGTAGDLERRGFSPWGHLDPTKKQTNITFAETLLRDKPQVVGIQIGINDFMHVDPFASNASAIGIQPAAVNHFPDKMSILTTNLGPAVRIDPTIVSDRPGIRFNHRDGTNESAICETVHG